MLGDFSLTLGRRKISDNDNRSHKVWLLLSYMIFSRDHSVSQQDLYRLLWRDESSSSNPVNALKTMFHRVRATLDGLGPNMGHQLIIRRQASYAWNTEIPFRLDVDLFEEACRQAEKESDPSKKLELQIQALSYYQGDFLSKLASEPWVTPLNIYYHNLFLDLVRSALPVLLETKRYQEAADLSRHALRTEPYSEELYIYLMRAQLALGDQKGTIETYETMQELLFSNFGIMPSEESTHLYREAGRFINRQVVDLPTLREQLRSTEAIPGALMCDYDFFQAIYCALSRSMSRNGDVAHIALISVCPKGKALSKRSLRCCMDNLQDLLRSNLRKGDIFARCSASQYVLLLPLANYENSRMICDRITLNFSRQYPHSPAYLQAGTQPMEPAE